MPRPVDPRRIHVIDDDTVRLYRDLSPGERIEIGLRAHKTVKLIVEAGIRHQHPDWNDEQVRDEVLRTMMRGFCSEWPPKAPCADS